MKQEKWHEHSIYNRENHKLCFSTNFPLDQKKRPDVLVIFNYGLVCSYQHWSRQLPYFDKKKFHILVHDYRGHFDSTGDIESLTFDNMVQDLREIIQAIRPKKIFMLGHSMGVNVTLEYARHYPKNLLGIVLISGTVLPPADVMFYSRIVRFLTPVCEWIASKYPGIKKHVWGLGKYSFVQRLVHWGGFNIAKVEIDFVEEYLSNIAKLHHDIFPTLMREMNNHDILNDLPKIKTPALVIAGERDFVIPFRVQKIIHDKLSRSELYLVPYGSHVPQVDFPKEINGRIHKFFMKQLE